MEPDKIIQISLKASCGTRDYDCFYATMCHVCKEFGDGVALKRCGGCGMIAYCSQEHQKYHWKQHKSLCKAVQDARRDDSVVNSDATSRDGYMRVIRELVTSKLKRHLERFEAEMFLFARKCIVCHERDGRLLEDCQDCFSASFCKDHRDNVEHKDFCDALKLCLYYNLANKTPLSAKYFQHVPDVSTFRNMSDYVNAAFSTDICRERIRNIERAPTETMAYNVFTAMYSRYLTYPLTLFHAMQILNYAAKSHLVIHVIAADTIEQTLITPIWEVLLHLMEPVMSLLIIMIGPGLRYESHPNQLSICKSCLLKKKKISLLFYQTFYDYYACSQFFVKPDFIIEFNIDLKEHNIEIRTPCIHLIAKQDCPYIFTCYKKELEEVDIINTILNKKVDYVYKEKNPFASLLPIRKAWCEQVLYQNCYVAVYKSLCS